MRYYNKLFYLFVSRAYLQQVWTVIFPWIGLDFVWPSLWANLWDVKSCWLQSSCILSASVTTLVSWRILNVRNVCVF